MLARASRATSIGFDSRKLGRFAMSEQSRSTRSHNRLSK